MKKFSQQLYPTVREETFFAPCGVADLIATCYGGRNRLVAMEYTRLVVVRTHSQSGWDAGRGGCTFVLRACLFWVLGPGFPL
jgi:glycerol-3-phosphate dehydrogenase (NAD+)